MRLGSYEVVRPLGSGGMSDAFLARSPTGRVVVLKRPRSYDPELLARMRDEGRLGARIFHTSLVETLDAFEHEGLPVLALGFVEGVTVDELRRAAPLPAGAVARLGCQIAEALGAIHAALSDDGGPLRAVHRDVSARNILVTRDGDAVLIDLGIARTDELRDARTETGMVLGTLRYMAPELIDGVPASPASDFYSLGCVLIEAATGVPVFTGVPSEIAAAIVTKGAMASDAAKRIEPRLAAVLTRMTAMSPAARFQEAHELSAALRGVEDGPAKGDLGRRAARAMAKAEAAAAAAEAAGPAPAPVSLAQAPAPIAPPPGTGGGTTDVLGATAPSVEPSSPSRPSPSPPPSLSSLPPPASFPPPPPSLAGPLAGPIGVPRPNDAPLELAMAPRPPKNRTIQGSNEWYPRPQRDYSALGNALKTVVVLAVLLVGGTLAWRWYDGKQQQETQDALERKAEQEAGLIRKALADTDECRAAGALWAYKDKRGHDVIVDSLGKVPKRYRTTARCAVPAH